MYVQPSRQGGFARNDAESAYPELWAGLTGAWVPALGTVSSRAVNTTGTQVEDLSGFCKVMQGDGPGTTKLETTGGPHLNFNATSFAYLECSTPNLFRSNGATIIVHKQKTDGTNRDAAIFSNTSLTASNFNRLFAPSASGNAIFDFGGNSGSNRLIVGGLTFGDDIWICRAGPKGMYLWQNGILVGSSSTGVTFGNGSSTYRWNASSTNSDLCRSKFFMTYDRELSDQDIMLLSHRPLAPFILKHPVKLLAGGGGVDLEQDVESALLFDPTATFNIDRAVSASSTLAFVSSGSGATVEEASTEIMFEHIADSELFIGDVHHISHDLGLVSTADGDNADVEEPNSPITFTQSLSVLGPIYVSAQDVLALADIAEAYLGVPWLPIEVESILEFTQIAGLVRQASASSTMSLVQAAYRSYLATSTLTLTDAIEYGKGPPSPQSSSLDLDHEVALNVDYIRVVEHTNILQDAFTFYIDNPCNRKQYTPFEGGESSMPEHRIQTRSTFTVETVTGPHTMLVLRNPEMDNRDRLGFNRVNRETRGGELNVFRDPTWASVNTLLFTIVALKREKIDALQQFLLDTLGQEIKIHDWTGAVWKGVVTTPNEAATEDQDGAWTLSFEFEGTLYPGQAPDGVITFTQVATATLLEAF